MEHKLKWLTKEEGRLVFLEENAPFMTIKVFLMDEESAEIQLQDIVFDHNLSKTDKICEKIIFKVTECLSETVRLLWEEGINETILVERQGTKIAEIIRSTTVAQKLYSEYMMKCRFERQESTDCGLRFLKLTETEDGYYCEHENKSFVCRLMRYKVAQPEENSFYLYEVEVPEGQRNKGIATCCLKELVRILGKEKPVTLYLQVGSYNEPAVHLYKKLGFEVMEELCYYEVCIDD